MGRKSHNREPAGRFCGISRVMPALGALCCVLGVGCTSTSVMTPEAKVEKRVMEWSEALMATDYDLALTYTTPGFQESPRAERYPADFGGSSWWTGVTLKDISCDRNDVGGRCEVRQIVEILRPPAIREPLPIPYDTVWLELDGVWYVFHD